MYLTSIVLVLLSVTGVASRKHPSPESVSETLKCSDDDEGGLFNYSSCATSDLEACADNCMDEMWCTHFCGTSCDEGRGAICAMKKLTHIERFCQAVGKELVSQSSSSVDGVMTTDDSLTHSVTASPKQVPTEANLQHEQDNIANMEHHGHSLDRKLAGEEEGVTASGCDKHVYCSYCSPYEECTDSMSSMAISILGMETFQFYMTQGYGPLSMKLIGMAEEVCDYYNITLYESESQGGSPLVGNGTVPLNISGIFDGNATNATSISTNETQSTVFNETSSNETSSNETSFHHKHHKRHHKSHHKHSHGSKHRSGRSRRRRHSKKHSHSRTATDATDDYEETEDTEGNDDDDQDEISSSANDDHNPLNDKGIDSIGSELNSLESPKMGPMDLKWSTGGIQTYGMMAGGLIVVGLFIKSRTSTQHRHESI